MISIRHTATRIFKEKHPREKKLQDICLAGINIRLKETSVIFSKFSIPKHGMIYCCSKDIHIDISQLQTGEYRIIVVQNFHCEDLNPDLHQCLSGIFLSMKTSDKTWQEPEGFPFECRSILKIGRLIVYNKKTFKIIPL